MAAPDGHIKMFNLTARDLTHYDRRRWTPYIFILSSAKGPNINTFQFAFAFAIAFLGLAFLQFCVKKSKK